MAANGSISRADDVQVTSLPRLTSAARVAAVWSAAGGSAAGGFLAVLLLLGRMHPDGAPVIAVLLATAGGTLGLVHGAVLGYLGGDPATGSMLRRRDRLLAIAVIPAAFVAAVALAVWIVLSAVLLRSGTTLGWPAFLGGAVLVLALVAWATALGWSSLERAYMAWPRHRLGAGLVAGAFLLLCTVLLGLRPAIPGTAVRLPAVGWIVAAALATIWVATPAIVIALRLGTARATGPDTAERRSVPAAEYND